MNHNFSLKKVIFIFALFPFFSFYPISTDIQPILFILICLYLIISKIKYDWFTFFLFIISVLFLVHPLISGNYDFKRNFSIFGILIFCLFMNKIDIKDIKNITFISLHIHFLLILINFYFPDFFNLFLSNFIPRVTYDFNDSRGAHGLNVEPGGAAAVLFVHFMILNFISDKYTDSKTNMFYVLCLVLFSLSLTKSGLGLICSFLIILQYSISNNLGKFLLIFLFPAFLFFIDIFISNFSRVGSLIDGFLSNGFHIIFLDASIAERVLSLIYGIYSLFDNIAGVGGGAYKFAQDHIEHRYALSHIFYSARSDVGLTSSAGIFLLEFGIFFILFFIIVIFYFFPRNIRSVIPFFSGITFILFSFSLLFPITWILFYLSKSYSKKINF